MNWDGWPLGRIVTLLIGAAYIMIFIQVTLFHYRQNFRHFAMWGPVIMGPAIGLAAVVLAVLNLPVLVTVVKVLFWIGVSDGLIGFYYHFKGVGQRVDGWVMQSFLVGPPIILPLMFGAMGIIGLFALAGS